MPRDPDTSERAFHELVRVLEVAAQAGADSVELEWEGRDLAVYQFFGNTGLGSVPIPEELQSAVLEEVVQRAGLRRKSKGRMLLTLNGEEYEVLVKEHDSFGESAFVLKLKKGGRPR